uniref:Uncharacterized protein n=1 Tax=Rhizophora mucronata TaxID=61149 RepID=A0A2P2M9P3_RHIMU
MCSVSIANMTIFYNINIICAVLHWISF